MTKEQQKNGYDDDDFKQIIDEIEGYEDEKASARAEAAGKCSALAKKIENAKKTAAALHIPKAVLIAVLKQRRLERQLQDLAESVPDDLAEVYEDASGQFSFLKPEDDEEPVATPASTAARRAKKAAQANQEAEQEEGAKVLDTLGGGVTH